MKTYQLKLAWTMFSLFLVLAVAMASCMTPRQTEAVLVLRDLYEHGYLTQDQFDKLLAALNPSTWVSDVVAIGTSLLSGGGAYYLVNKRRDALREARGEPVAVPQPAPNPQS